MSSRRMDVLHIPAKSTIKAKLSQKQIASLPKKIGVIAAVQFMDQVNSLTNQLQGVRGGQVLGCDASAAEKIGDKVAAFLYVGSGTFHPINVCLKTKKPVYCFNPKTGQLTKLGQDIIAKAEKKRKAAVVRFLSAEKIGILVSTKPGQNNLKGALSLKSALKEKKCYIFVFDTLDISELENFSFIKCWVNTACPRIADEKANILNLEDAILISG